MFNFTIFTILFAIAKITNIIIATIEESIIVKHKFITIIIIITTTTTTTTTTTIITTTTTIAPSIKSAKVSATESAKKH